MGTVTLHLTGLLPGLNELTNVSEAARQVPGPLRVKSPEPSREGEGWGAVHSPLAVPSCFARESSGLGSACLCTAGFGSSGSSSSGVTSFIRLWLHTLATSLMPMSADVRSSHVQESSLSLSLPIPGLSAPQRLCQTADQQCNLSSCSPCHTSALVRCSTFFSQGPSLVALSLTGSPPRQGSSVSVVLRRAAADL